MITKEHVKVCVLQTSTGYVWRIKLITKQIQVNIARIDTDDGTSILPDKGIHFTVNKF